MEKRGLLLILCGLLFFTSCGKKNENSSELISGSESKVWKATKELNRQGDKEKLTKDEKKEELKFYSNGTFTVSGETDHQEGKWNYTPSDKSLSLQYTGQQISENFNVVEMEDDHMKLQAPDGSVMVLEAD